jgi:hypothetical protein
MRPAPADAADRGWTRIAVLRVLVAGYVGIWTIVRAPALLDTTGYASRRFDPVGPLALLDAPLPDAVVVALVVVTPVAALLFAAGRARPVSGWVAAVGFLLVTTYRNSWGQLFHTENLAALHLVVLAMVSPRRERDAEWAVRAMAVLTVGAYVVAGVAKLRISGTAWLDGDVLRHQIAFDNARKELLGDTTSPFAPWILGQDWLLAPAAWATMVVEFGAPLALLGRRIAALWCATAWAFHIAVLVFMAILFPYQLFGIALAPLLPVERIPDTVAGWRARSRPVSRPSPRPG